MAWREWFQVEVGLGRNDPYRTGVKRPGEGPMPASMDSGRPSARASIDAAAGQRLRVRHAGLPAATGERSTAPRVCPQPGRQSSARRWHGNKAWSWRPRPTTPGERALLMSLLRCSCFGCCPAGASSWPSWSGGSSTADGHRLPDGPPEMSLVMEAVTINARSRTP